MLVHCLRADHSASEAAVADIRLFGAWADYPAIAFDPYDALRILLTEKKLMGKRLGYEGDFLPIQQYQKLQALSGGAEMVDAGELLKRFNAVKNDYEINLMRLSSYLTNIGMRAAVEHIRQSEAEASMAAEAAMREAWKRDLVEFEVSGFGNTEGGFPLPSGATRCQATGSLTALSAQGPESPRRERSVCPSSGRPLRDIMRRRSALSS